MIRRSFSHKAARQNALIEIVADTLVYDIVFLYIVEFHIVASPTKMDK
jgi:hypothetical protein